MKAITTKYHGPTDTRVSRITADAGDGNRVSVSYDYGARDPEWVAAKALITKMGWAGTWIKGGIKGASVFVDVNGDQFVAPAHEWVAPRLPGFICAECGKPNSDRVHFS